MFPRWNGLEEFSLKDGNKLFNPCGEFRWSPEGPVSLIHSPHFHVGSPGIFSDLVRSVQMLKREWGAESNGWVSHLFIPGKTAALVPEFAGEDLYSAELQSWFLRLQWKTCPWTKHSDDDDGNSPLDSRFAGSNPAGVDGFFQSVKILSRGE